MSDTAEQTVDIRRTRVGTVVPPLRGKQLAALRAIAGTAGGLRIAAYRSTMPLLMQMGLVEERAVPASRHREGRAWFLTGEGRATVKAYGADEA